MKRFLLIGVPILIILGLVGWRYVAKTGQDAQLKSMGQQRKNAPSIVNMATAGPASIDEALDLVATIESPYQVKLSPNISGRIDYLEVREGDAVKAGQILARINPAEVEGQINQAQSALAEAKQRLAQAKITQDANSVGIYSTVNQQHAATASAQADYDSTAVNYEQQVAAAHQAVVSAQSTVSQTEAQIHSAEANRDLAQANLDNARAKYNRTLSLYQQGFIAPQDVDDAKTTVKVGEQTVKADDRLVDAAKSANNSAQAQYKAALNQEAIAKKKGQSDIADAKAKWTQAKATLNSAVANKSQIPAYAENLRALESEVSSAQAALSQAIARRAYLNVGSSIDGTVTQRFADPGAEASPGSPILVVQFLQWVYLTSAVPVEYSDQVRVGMPVTVHIDGLSGKPITAVIKDVNKSADPTNRQFMIRTRLDNPGALIRPGMFGHVGLVISQVSAEVAVPREAVTTSASNSSTVTVVGTDMVAHVVPVTVGVQDSKYVQILSGLKAGNRVVTLSYRPVPDGGKVTEGSWTKPPASGPGQGKGRQGGSKGGGSSAPNAG